MVLSICSFVVFLYICYNHINDSFLSFCRICSLIHSHIHMSQESWSYEYDSRISTIYTWVNKVSQNTSISDRNSMFSSISSNLRTLLLHKTVWVWVFYSSQAYIDIHPSTPTSTHTHTNLHSHPHPHPHSDLWEIAKKCILSQVIIEKIVNFTSQKYFTFFS